MDLMARRRVMLSAGKRSRLPREYQESEYLVGNGGQYINTEIVLTKGCVISIRFMTQNPAPTSQVLYGWRYRGSYNNQYQLFVNNEDPNQRLLGVGKTVDASPRSCWANGVETTMIFDTDSNKLLINGTDFMQRYPNSFSYANGTCFDDNGSSTIPPFLFSFNKLGAAAAFAKGQKIFKYSVTINGAFIQNFVPCYRESDSKPGMYDLAGSICSLTNSPFYINAGTGEFLVGPDVN